MAMGMNIKATVAATLEAELLDGGGGGGGGVTDPVGEGVEEAVAITLTDNFCPVEQCPVKVQI